MVWFEIVLVVLTLFTGLVWLLDKLWLRKPLVGNLDVVGKFDVTERLTNQSRE